MGAMRQEDEAAVDADAGMVDTAWTPNALGAPGSRLRLTAQVIHKRTYGNRLVFLDVCQDPEATEAPDDATDAADPSAPLRSSPPRRRQRADSAVDHAELAAGLNGGVSGGATSSTAGCSPTGGKNQTAACDWVLEIVFKFEVYGSDVRKLGKDISPGDVAEFEGVLEPCGSILDAHFYRILRRWRDRPDGGISFKAPPVHRSVPHDVPSPIPGGERARNSDKVRESHGKAKMDEEALESIGLIQNGRRLCKFWISNKDCQRAGCKWEHPAGEEFEQARNRYFEILKRRRAGNANPDDPHSAGGKKSHNQRAAVFANWLCETYGLAALRRDGVVDIAGGRGDLAFELAVKRQIPCTTVDPRCPGDGTSDWTLRSAPWASMRLSRPQKAWLESNVPTCKGFASCQAYVEKHCPLRQCRALVTKDCAQTEGDERALWEQLVGNCRVIVGLHPDQATGGVLDLAVAFNKSFAVVPCCTFADDFPERQLATGALVRTYDDLVEWLKVRADAAEVAFLGFLGKNLAVFRRPGEHAHDWSEATDAEDHRPSQPDACAGGPDEERPRMDDPIEGQS